MIDERKEFQGLENGLELDVHVNSPSGKKKQNRKETNWKTPDHDGIHGFWLTHTRLSTRDSFSY